MSLAALLIIGFLMVYDKPLEDTSMAINDTKEEFDPALVKKAKRLSQLVEKMKLERLLFQQLLKIR
jgi:hypothetical protein